MDGTLNLLTFELQCHDTTNYSSRKYGYSLCTLMVNDNKQRIMYYLDGWPGSTHENSIFKNLCLFQEYNVFLVSVSTCLEIPLWNVSPLSLEHTSRQDDHGSIVRKRSSMMLSQVHESHQSIPLGCGKEDCLGCSQFA